MANTFLSKTLGTSTNTYKGTVSLWFKKSQVSSDQVIYGNYTSGTQRGKLVLASDNKLMYYQNDGGSVTIKLETTRLFRDFSAWYHVVLSVDTTQGTASDRVKLYVNGVQETVFDTETYPNQNTVFYLNANSVTNYIGQEGNSSDYWDGSMTHIHVVDGTAYPASTFGETDSTSGIWIAKTAPSVTYGTNGFFLKFENSGAMGTDSSGNSNTFTVGGTLTQNVDTPSNNFATINPLYYSSTGLLNGNLTATSTGNSHKNYHSTIAVDSGKWYAEMKVNSWNGSNNIMFGIVADSWNNINSTSPGDNFAGNASTGIGYGSDGQKIIANSASSYGNSFTTGDILGIALDLTNNKLYFSKNGTWQNSGVPTSGGTGTGAIDAPSGFTRLITFSHYGSQSCSMNFGQGYFGTTQVASAGTAPSEGGIFEYDCPSGYQALCTKGINSF